MIKEYNGNNTFEEEIKDGVTVVDFYATWCGPCKMLAPSLMQFSNDNPDVKVLKVDVDKYKEVADSQDVMSVPTILFYSEGEVKYKQVGFSPAESLQEVLNDIK